MEIRIAVEAEDLRDRQKFRASTAYFMMIALDAEGRPAEVPSLIISTEEEARLFNEGQTRYEVCRAPS